MATRLTRSESKAATREELLGAARRVFLDRGYHGASLDLVAREAGYTKGAVYSAFASKADLFLAVYDREQERRREALERVTLSADAMTQAQDWLERVRSERAWVLALLEFRLHAARDEAINAAFAERHARFLDDFAELLTRAGIPADGDGARVALLGVAMANGMALEHLVLPDEATGDRLSEALVALAAAPPSPRR